MCVKNKQKLFTLAQLLPMFQHFAKKIIIKKKGDFYRTPNCRYFVMRFDPDQENAASVNPNALYVRFWFGGPIHPWKETWTYLPKACSKRSSPWFSMFPRLPNVQALSLPCWLARTALPPHTNGDQHDWEDGAANLLSEIKGMLTFWRMEIETGSGPDSQPKVS